MGSEQMVFRAAQELRDNDVVRQAFHDEVKGLTQQWGLTLPEWKPNW